MGRHLKNLRGLGTHSSTSWSRVFALALLLVPATALPALAEQGSIYTTLQDGTTVNTNVYSSKADVYLNGGPQNDNGKGLDDGDHYFQVTEPSGATLLSTDGIECRRVKVVNGRIFGVSGAGGCSTHLEGILNPANGSKGVQLLPYDDTPNNGGEYKVWLIPVGEYDAAGCAANHGFCSGSTKTDNFKVKPDTATVKVCKFNDCDGNGI